MNEVTLLGRPTEELEIKYTQKNTEYVRFSLAVNTGYGDYKKTTFVNCMAYKSNAKALTRTLKPKGRVLLKGELTNNEYENKNGQKVYELYLLVQSVLIIDFKDKKENINKEENFDYFNDSSNFLYPDEM